MGMQFVSGQFISLLLVFSVLSCLVSCLKNIYDAFLQSNFHIQFEITFCQLQFPCLPIICWQMQYQLSADKQKRANILLLVELGVKLFRLFLFYFFLRANECYQIPNSCHLIPNIWILQFSLHSFMKVLWLYMDFHIYI